MWQLKSDLQFEYKRSPLPRRFALVGTKQRERNHQILLPVDFTSAAERAVKRIVNHTHPEKTVVRVLINIHKFAPPAIAVVNCDGSLGQLWSRVNFRAHVRAEALAATLREANFAVETVVRHNLLDFVAVMWEARQWQADELVLGLGGFSPLKHLFLHSAFELALD
jgi:nucleotide-binding universal stress UspA family protein